MLHGPSEYVGYIRVSTDDQAENGLSLKAQRDKVRAFAGAHSLDLFDIIEDPGQSARSLDRPGMKDALRFLGEGGGGLIIAKLDRLTRSVRDWSCLVDDHFSKPGGPRLLSASETIETRTSSGRFVANILMAAAQFELERGVERTEEVMGPKRTKGERLGTIPYGSKLAEDGRTLVACLPEVEALRVMVGLRQGGWILRDIAAEMDRLGYPTRNGKGWAISTVSKLLADAEAQCAPTT